MIRTRDLVLFIICLIFLGILIVATVFQSGSSKVLSVADWDATNGEQLAFEGETPASAEIDRAGNIARLRAKIAADTSAITPQPDTFVEDVIIPEVHETGGNEAAPGVRSCLYPDDMLARLAHWPLSGVQVVAAGRMRTVSYIETIAVEASVDATATGTPTSRTETITRNLASLPLFPSKSPSSSCVPSQVIGVTTGGTMMFNSDAKIWLNVDTNTLIGYARDGFPIYGRYDGPLDTCGGYDHPAGYRYSISTERSYIIGCFTATPQSFNL